MPRHDTMFLFFRALRRWVPYIKRKAYLSELTVETSNGTVRAHAKWVGTSITPAGEHTIIFDRQRVLGSRGSKAPLQQRPVKGICKFADDVIREILQARKIT